MLDVPGTWVPLVNLRGTYVLPGVPRLFRSMLEAHVGRFAGPAHRQAELLTDMGEGDLAGEPRGPLHWPLLCEYSRVWGAGAPRGPLRCACDKAAFQGVGFKPL